MLWSKTFIESVIRYDILNSFIKDIIIEEKRALDSYAKLGYILKWKLLTELNLIFVAAYKELSHMVFVEELLDMICKDFSTNVFG